MNGDGPNFDSLGVRDDRTLARGLGFTVEPSVYLPGRFGVRSEINIYLGQDALEVTTESQARITPVLAR